MSLGTLDDDLLGGDDGAPVGDVVVGGAAELGPVAALEGALAEARVGELADANDGGDLDLVAFVVELVLDDLLDAVLVGPDHLARRQEEVQVLAVVLVQLSPPELRRRLGGHRSLSRHG